MSIGRSVQPAAAVLAGFLWCFLCFLCFLAVLSWLTFWRLGALSEVVAEETGAALAKAAAAITGMTIRAIFKARAFIS